MSCFCGKPCCKCSYFQRKNKKSLGGKCMHPKNYGKIILNRKRKIKCRYFDLKKILRRNNEKFN